MQYIYENKKNGNRIVSSERLDNKYWKLISKLNEWRNTRMKYKEINKKKCQQKVIQLKKK